MSHRSNDSSAPADELGVDSSDDTEPTLAEALFRVVGWETRAASLAAAPTIVADDRRDSFAAAARRLLSGLADVLGPLGEIPGFVVGVLVDVTTGQVISSRPGGRGIDPLDVAPGLVAVMNALSAWVSAMGGTRTFGESQALVFSAADGMIAVRAIDDRHVVAVVTDLDSPEATKVGLTAALRALQPEIGDLLRSVGSPA